MKHELDSFGPGGRNGACPCPDCRLSPQGPPADLRDKAVAIWCGTHYDELAMKMGQDAAEECASAFAYGFEKGLTTAMLRPEWAQALLLEAEGVLPSDPYSSGPRGLGGGGRRDLPGYAACGRGSAGEAPGSNRRPACRW